MFNNNGIVAPEKPKRQIQFTTQTRRTYVQSFESSNKTMTAYCEEHGIPISTFSAWVTKYGKRQQAGFVPVQVQGAMSAQKTPVNQKTIATQVIEIHRGDLKVVLPMIDVTMAVEIIKEVLLCS